MQSFFIVAFASLRSFEHWILFLVFLTFINKTIWKLTHQLALSTIGQCALRMYYIIENSEHSFRLLLHLESRHDLNASYTYCSHTLHLFHSSFCSLWPKFTWTHELFQNFRLILQGERVFVALSSTHWWPASIYCCCCWCCYFILAILADLRVMKKNCLHIKLNYGSFAHWLFSQKSWKQMRVFGRTRGKEREKERFLWMSLKRAQHTLNVKSNA